MAEPERQGALATFSTRELPERDRLAAWRDFYAGRVLRLDWEPRSDLPFEAKVAVRKLPELTLYRTRFSPATVRLTRKLMGQEDSFTLFLSSRTYRLVHAGREIELGPGEAVLLSNTEETAVTSLHGGQHMGIVLGRAPLRMLSPCADDMLLCRIPQGAQELSLLAGYLRLLHAGQISLARPETQRVVATHIHELIALMLGATRDAAEMTRRRGLCAARLHAMREDIRRNLARPDLSVHAIAARHRVSARYVQMLFEEGGSTFTRFLLEQRLRAAHKALAARPNMQISAIAYDHGFNDVSNFNRAFRGQFGCTPSDARKASLTSRGGNVTRSTRGI
jgi:AraC-like DNA-binding protein